MTFKCSVGFHSGHHLGLYHRINGSFGLISCSLVELVLSIFYIIITSRTTTTTSFHYLSEFHHFSCENYWFSYRTLLFWLKQEKANQKKKRQYVRRVDEPINASQEEFLPSPVAPVDVFHQDCHEINKPRLSAQWDRWLHMPTVCVSPLPELPEQNCISSVWLWTKTSAAVRQHPL